MLLANASLPVTDLVVLLVYVGIVILFGCWFVRSSGNSEAFMIAGGTIPGWAVGLSIFGTFLSSNTFLGVPGNVYGANWNKFVFSLSLPIAAWIATRYFVPFYRRGGEISAYHHFETRFGPWARTYGVVCYLLAQIGRVGTIMYGVALGLNALTGWDIGTLIVITGVLVTVYTLLGGIEAVIWTDVVQSIVLLGGAVLILFLLLTGTPGGFGESFSIAHEAGKTSLGSWSADMTISTVWVVLAYGLVINLVNFGIDQGYVQRYHTAKTEREATRAVWLGALLYVPVSLMFFVIGAALFGYFEANEKLKAEVRAEYLAEQPERDAANEVTDKDIADRVLPYFIANRLPVGVSGLLIAAIFAAAMSSIDTSLNSSATIILKDLYQRYWKPHVSEQTSLWVLRIGTIAMGVIGTGISLALIGVKSILDAWWSLQGVLTGGVLGLFLLGIASTHTTRVGAIVATIIGTLAIGWMTFSPGQDNLPEALRNPLDSSLTIVVGTVVIFLTGLLFRSPSQETSP